MTVAALAVWSAVVLVWLRLLLEQARVGKEGLLLEPSTEPGPSDSVCVIVPTRNAARTIRRCAQRILKQDHAHLRLIVVDDRSTDATPAVLAALAAHHDRMEVRRVDALPAGWLGKSHALWVASRGVPDRWLLFVDDDCLLEPQAVRTALLEAHRRRLDVLSLWPRHGGASTGEHLVIPLCGGIIALWFDDASRPRRVRRPLANGQFLLMTADAYARCGGHESVRDCLIEDVALAERAGAAGLRCLTASGLRLLTVRMYEGLRSAMQGWARIFTGALRSGTKIAMSIAWLLFGSLLPFAAAPILLITTLRADAPTPTLLALDVLCGAHLLLLGVVSYRFWGMGGCPRRYLLLYPLSVILVVGILARAWWWLIVGRRVRWRETWYRIDRRGRIVGAPG